MGVSYCRCRSNNETTDLAAIKQQQQQKEKPSAALKVHSNYLKRVNTFTDIAEQAVSVSLFWCSPFYIFSLRQEMRTQDVPG